jgi:hypothetical protein
MNGDDQNRGYCTAFIPHKLDIEDRPELSDFSKNILFATLFNSNGVVTIASSLYEPDLKTYRDEGEARSLIYKNIYNPDDTVKIIRREDKWEGEKLIKDKRALWAWGLTWQQFFVQLTGTGLCRGERCKFETLNELQKKANINPRPLS